MPLFQRARVRRRAMHVEVGRRRAGRHVHLGDPPGDQRQVADGFGTDHVFHVVCHEVRGPV